ncbi:MAG TPA: sulfate adenylyltransferase [Malonomonas sp.]
MKRKNVQIICTVGPTSLNQRVLRCLEVRNVSLVRLNMSHIDIDKLPLYLEILKQFSIPIAIDTEGSQIRTGIVESGTLNFHLNDIVRIHSTEISCDQKNFYLTPLTIAAHIYPGDLIAIDFNSVQLRVEDVSMLQRLGYIEARVIIEGKVGSRKGVHCSRQTTSLPPFSAKDLQAFELAKQIGIKHFTLSFMNSASDVRQFREILPDAVAYAKIETAAGVRNVEKILPYVDGILIDRGDLSREIPIEKISLAQKYLIELTNQAGKTAFVASNLLETMATELKPTRAEVNDIVNTVLDGVGGFVLTSETAVGRYPVETVNMLQSLINQGQLALSHAQARSGFSSRSIDLSFLADKNYLLQPEICSGLPAPHGGELVDRLVSAPASTDGLPVIKVGVEALVDLGQIGIGTFSPLTGFMNERDFQAVLDRMHLANGTPWPLPIILAVDDETRQQLSPGGKALIASARDGRVYGSIAVEDVYPFCKETYARKVYGTTDAGHPGVQRLERAGDYLVGGAIELYQRPQSRVSRLHLTPRQVRDIFSALGWAKVVGMHTRNVAHRAHEFLMLRALEKYGCDGLLIHPASGKKKSGDFQAKVIVDSYELLLEKYLPTNRVVLGVFSTFSRYAGPREAVFTALCRKNYGCSHFIVGWDHAGFNDLYPPFAAQEIFSQFDNLGIEPVFFNEVGYCQRLGTYLERTATVNEELKQISGSESINMLIQKKLPPDWFMRPEIARMIIATLERGEPVFVP